MKNLFTVLLTFLVSLAAAQNDTWTAREDYAGEGRFIGAAFAIGTKVYAGTGLNDDFLGVDDFYEYDIATDTWTPKGNFDGGVRYGSTSFSINGKGYIAFGTDGAVGFNDIWEYTPATDSWEKKTDFPGGARAGAFVFVVNNKAYIGGGQDMNTAALNDLWVFDPVANAWTQLASFTGTPRLYAVAFAIGTKGYMGTGIDAEDNSLADFWEYNTVNNTWTRKADHPKAVPSGIAFATATRGYMGLGQSPELYSYYPNDDVWVREADYPVPFIYLNASAVYTGGKAYVGLGLGTPSTAAFYSYTPGTEQAITFGALAAKTFGNTPFDLTATASSSLAVTYTSSNTSVATVSGTTVTIVGAGSTIITANQVGNGTYDAALPVKQTLTVDKANQTISFGTLAVKDADDDPFNLTATASSALAVSYSSSNTSVATISGSTVTITGAGTTKITAIQAGNNNYNAAASVEQELVVSKLNQTITFASLPQKHPGDQSFNLTATASSGLPVSYTSSNTSVATVSGSTLTIVGGGTTKITASQAGNGIYNAAPAVERDLNVVKNAQTWVGSLPVAGGYGNDIVVTVQLSSGLLYTLTSSNQNVATVAFNGTNYVISPKAIGTTTLTASHGGNASYEAAPTITAELVISKGTQTISFNTLPIGSGVTYTIVTATASSGLPVVFDPMDISTGIVVTGNILTAYGSYDGNITARQAGNDFYLPVEVTQKLTLTKMDMPLNMEPFAEKSVGDPPFVPLVTTLWSNVVYTLSSTNPNVATIVAGKVNIVGKGTANIYAVNAGTSQYNASSTYRELVVKEPHTLTFAELPSKVITDAPFTVSATSSQGVPVVFTSADPTIATIEGNTVTIQGVGSTFITASSGNSTYTMKTASSVLEVKNIDQPAIQQGQFWGVVSQGGKMNSGLIYKTDADGSGLSVVKELKGGADEGTHPSSSVVVGSNGKLYGSTYTGGKNNGGTFFEFDPATSTMTKKYDYGFADYPVRTFVPTSNGKIYGVKVGGLDDEPGHVVFEFDVNTGTFTKKKTLSGMISWASDIFKSSNGKIYITGSGGSQLESRVFLEYDPATNTVTKKAQVAWSTPSTVATGPAEAANGKFYGVVQSGGANNEGYIYEFDPVAGTVTQKADFPKANFNYTWAQGLTRASNGKIYGCAQWGGINKNGYVFEFDPVANTITTVADFPTFLGVPTGQMVEAPNGKLYGTDNSGNMGGSLFEFNPATNVLTTQLIFNDYTGKAGWGNVGILNGKVYVYNNRGGKYNSGTVVEFDYTTRAVKNNYDFNSAIEGYTPMVGLTATGNGKLYGVNKYGGTYDEGNIFEYDLATDTYKGVYDFNGATVGSNPHTPLLLGFNGKLYGSTRFGSVSTVASGTLFEFDPRTKTYQTLIRLTSESGLGINHQLVQAKSGKLYGLMQYGGSNSNGALFEFDPVTKAYRKLVDFTTAQGSGATTAPTIASNGKIYGTLPNGGANGEGVLFEYDLATETYTVKHNFESATGVKPHSILTEVDGKLWGTTATGGGGNNKLGVIFEYNLSTGVYTKKYDFDQTGNAPGGKMLRAANGKLYVLTTSGASAVGGLVIEYDIATNTITKRSEIPGSNGFGYSINYLVQTSKSFKTAQTITVTPIAAKVLGQPAFTPTATATSGLPVSFTAGSAHITFTDGKVTMVKAGKATLKANQAGNANYAPAPQVEVVFCVNPPKPEIIPTTTATGTVILSVSATTGNKWYKDGAAIAGATNNTYEATTAGVYTVDTEVEGCKSELSNAAPIVVTGDMESNGSFSLYPNPVESKLYIVLPGSNRKRVTLIQADGRVAEQHETSASLLEVDVRSYAAGLYLVHVRDEKGVYPAMKFIKK